MSRLRTAPARPHHGRIPARRFQDDSGYTVEIDLTDDLRGPAGSMHGGLVTALIDIAAATAVAYSRVHTGVHYPADAIAGSVIGTSVAAVVCRVLDRS